MKEQRLGRAALAVTLLALWTQQVFAGGAPTALRGPVAVYLRPNPGPLTITITKRDLNIYEGADTLTAVLADPQRRTLASVTLPDDGRQRSEGRNEKVQTETLRAECETPGVYRLLFTGSGDLVYGFETDCARYVIQGGVVLNDGAIGGKVYFKPPSGAIKGAAGAMHAPGKQALPLLDAAGATVQTLDLTREDAKPADLFGERSSGTYIAGQKIEVADGAGDRTGLWAFDIARMDVRIRVQGVNHWAFAREAWFDATKSRWMLTPYSIVRHLNAGEKAVLTFQLRNSTGADGKFRLTARGETGLSVRVLEPASPVALKASGVQQVRVEVVAGSEVGAARRGLDPARRGMLVAEHETDPDASAGAGIVIRGGEAPARRPLAMQIVLKPYQHENALFGYAPDYMVNEVHFDPRNRPWIRQRDDGAYVTTGFTFLSENGWTERPFMDAVQTAFPDYAQTIFGGGFLGAKTAFDGQGGVYTLLRIRLKNGRQTCVALFTADEGLTYSAHEFNATAFDIEQFTGHNRNEIPPPILGYRQTREHPAKFCGYHDLELYLPARDGNKLSLGKPVPVSDNCLGSCQHSGGPGSLATRDGKTHIVWGEVAPDDAPGVPTYIATYDHAAKAMGKKVFLAYGPPVNDVHNVPAIALDSEGYLHVLSGAHGEPFKYLRSLKPNDAYSGFTEPEPILDAGCVDDTSDADGRGRQTYISLVCGRDSSLYTAYRQWRRNADEHHPGQSYAALSFQSKPKGKAWSRARPLVIPPLPGYSIYYHKLTIDRSGRLFLCYSLWSGEETYQDDFFGRYPHSAILTSPDGGQTWKLAETRDFVQTVAP